MGLLDEAIREHLELKRRQGADPGEVQRLEGEALGPPRAEPVPGEAEASPQAEPEQDDEVAAAEAAPHAVPAPAPAPDAVAAPAPPAGRVVGGAVSMDDYVVEHPDPGPQRQPANPAPDAADADDVLEETPEFLQETPEHERLWFEQKPPKDFDF